MKPAPTISHAADSPSAALAADAQSVGRRSAMNLDLDQMSVRELLAVHSRVSHQLRENKVCRTGNNPVADYAEWLCRRAMALQLVGNSMAGYDALDSENRRYEIKARRQTPLSKPTHFSAIRGLPEQHFDFLIAVLFSEDFSVSRAALLPFAAVQRLARFRKHVNGSYLYLRDAWACTEAQDVTQLLAAA